VKIQALGNLLRISEIKFREYWLLSVPMLSARYSSAHSTPPSFCLASWIGATTEDDDQWMKPLARCVLILALIIPRLNCE